MRNDAVRVREEIGFGGSYAEISVHSDGDLTLAEFLWELADIEDGFDWTITQGGRIRAHLKGGSRRLFAPATALVYFRTGRFIPEEGMAEAARLIGLHASDCISVVAACNYAWEPTCPQGELRRDILAVLMPSESQHPRLNPRLPLAEMGREPRRRIAPMTH